MIGFRKYDKIVGKMFAGWIMTQKDTEDELSMTSGYALWRFLIRYVAPIGIGVIFVANLG